MGKLMDHYGKEQAHNAARRHQPVIGLSVSGETVWEESTRKRRNHQYRENKPACIQPDLESHQIEQPDASTEHGGHLSAIGLNWAGWVAIKNLSKLTAHYNFCIQTNCTDGAGPLSALVEGVDGNLYGTTNAGGASNEGTVFKLAVGLPLHTNFQSTLADITKSRQLGLITNQLTANALTAVIDAAQAAPERDRKLILEGFVQLVKLLARGKLVTGTAPQILVNDANSLIV